MHVWMKQNSRLLPLLSPSAEDRVYFVAVDLVENVSDNAFLKVLMNMQMLGCLFS